MFRQAFSLGDISAASVDHPAPTVDARRFPFNGWDRLTVTGIFLTVGGWALIWICAVTLVQIVAPPAIIAIVIVGFTLIPLHPPFASWRGPRGMSLPVCLLTLGGLAVASCVLATSSANAQNCPVSHEQLTQALKGSVKASGGPGNGGFDNNEWAAVVTRDGVVCAVTFSGAKPDDQWIGSRAIAAEKANTANALSLAGMAMSTANLYAGAQPGGPLYGLTQTNPPVGSVAYAGDPKSFGGPSDPLVGKTLGGVVVFGGGLPLYGDQGIVGGLGVSGDTSCADHNIGWRVRHTLGLDHVPNGVSSDHNDAIIYDMLPDKTSASGFGHPQCGGSEAEVAAQIRAGVVPQWAQVMKK